MSDSNYIETSNITVIGLGKLGAPLAATLAAKGFSVTGIDVNARFVDAINAGQAPVKEPRLQEMINAGRGRLGATQDVAGAIAASDVSFIIVPTPSKADGSFSTDFAVEAARGVAEGLKRHQGFHLVVVVSTVLPGDTERDLIPILESGSGKKCGLDFGVCYNPEFVALGNVINDILRPDFILIGESDTRAGDILEGLYSKLCDYVPPAARMNFINAELTKISINTYITTRLSYANMLAEICSKLPGADVDEVTGALGMDTRIGKKYLRGAVSYGGPCFPRDNRAFAKIAHDIGIDPIIAEATDAMNAQHIRFITETVTANLSNHKHRVAMLGVSYKPTTPVIEASASIPVIIALLEYGCEVMLHDPQALEAARCLFGDKVDYAKSITGAVKDADAVIIMTAWDSFSTLSVDDLKSEETLVIDCWRILDQDLFRKASRYMVLGVGPQNGQVPSSPGIANQAS